MLVIAKIGFVCILKAASVTFAAAGFVYENDGKVAGCAYALCTDSETERLVGEAWRTMQIDLGKWERQRTATGGSRGLNLSGSSP
jgi:hypothetical protein